MLQISSLENSEVIYKIIYYEWYIKNINQKTKDAHMKGKFHRGVGEHSLHPK